MRYQRRPRLQTTRGEKLFMAAIAFYFLVICGSIIAGVVLAYKVWA